MIEFRIYKELQIINKKMITQFKKIGKILGYPPKKDI